MLWKLERYNVIITLIDGREVFQIFFLKVSRNSNCFYNFYCSYGNISGAIWTQGCVGHHGMMFHSAITHFSRHTEKLSCNISISIDKQVWDMTHMQEIQHPGTLPVTLGMYIAYMMPCVLLHLCADIVRNIISNICSHISLIFRVPVKH